MVLASQNPSDAEKVALLAELNRRDIEIRRLELQLTEAIAGMEAVKIKYLRQFGALKDRPSTPARMSLAALVEQANIVRSLKPQRPGSGIDRKAYSKARIAYSQAADTFHTMVSQHESRFGPLLKNKPDPFT